MSAPVEEKTTTVAPSVTTPTPQAEAKVESHKVFVGNLSFTTTDESLEAFFNKSGKVVETIIVKRYKKPKGYGFVGYATVAEAEKATKDLDKTELDGREISVQLAKPREPRPEKEEKPKKKSSKKSRKSKAKKEKEPATETSTESPSSSPEPIAPVETPKEQPATTKEQATTTKPKTTVFVANLPRKYKLKDLEELFKEFDVESALVAIQSNGRSKGYGFVELKTVDEMQRVLTEFVDIEVEGHPIHVSAATSEKNTERKVKPRRRTSRNPSSRATKSQSTDDDAEPTQKKNKKRSKKSNATEKESVEVSKEAVKESGAEAAKEVKKDNDTKATKEEVKEVKKVESVKPTKEVKEPVKEVKEPVKEVKEPVKEVKEPAKEVKEPAKEVKKGDAAETTKKAKK